MLDFPRKPRAKRPVRQGAPAGRIDRAVEAPAVDGRLQPLVGEEAPEQGPHPGFGIGLAQADPAEKQVLL